MSKVVKIIGIIAAVASVVATAGASLSLIAAGGSLFGLGISATAFSAIAIGASIGSSLLSKSSSPANSSTNVDRMRANVDPRTTRKTVVGGPTAMAVDAR